MTEKPAISYHNDCTEDASDAKSACSQPQSTAGMNPQQAQQMQMMQAQAQQANAATSGASAQQQQQQAEQEAQMCKLQADLSAALGAMSALKGNACSGQVSSCNKSCGQAAKDFDQLIHGPTATGSDQAKVPGWSSKRGTATKAAAKCSGFGGNSMDMMQAAGALLGGMLQNLMCNEMYATASPTPTSVGTCADPTFAATSVLCVCQNDPKNAMCTAPQQFPSGLTTTAGDLGTTAPPQGTADDGSDGQAVKADSSKPDDARGSATTGEGGGGAGGLQAARPNPLNPTGDDRPAASNVDKSVITGTMGGSGGGASGGGGGSAAAANQRGGGGSGKGAFDLSKFLPKAATRGIAGMSITAKDGITGPMGPSIWEKISNQYQLQKPNLIPEQQ
jgi:hypothetical protein